jgi:hypothetical protein
MRVRRVVWVAVGASVLVTLGSLLRWAITRTKEVHNERGDREASRRGLVEAETEGVDEEGNFVSNDLVAAVDDDGRIVATDETIAVVTAEGDVIVDETLSVMGEDGELHAVEEDRSFIETDAEG